VGAGRYIIVTATDNTYLPLALDLLRSLRRLKPRVAFDIGVLDLSLSDAAKTQLTPFGVTLKQPVIDIDYPGRTDWERQAPFYRAMTARPYLCDYFPGYDALMWMDADTWAQTPEAIETMLPAAAADDALYIVSEFDRDYRPYFQGSQPWDYHLKWYMANFPADMVHKIFPRPMLNSGVMALAPRAPVWKKWQSVFTQCLQRLPQLGRENFMAEQLSLNMAVYLEGLPLKIMPAEFNWLALYALPVIDEKTSRYVRPTPPRGPLSVLHVTLNKKLGEVDLMTTGGKTVRRALTFSAFEAGTSPA
jgi:lipopolysaccharide biosynthesis glycosyltransferase